VSSTVPPDLFSQHPNFEPSEFCFNSWNQPFAPSDRRTAEEIVGDERNEYHDKETGLDKIRKTLIHSWHEVEEETRGETRG
jgi:hypothetical protein